MQNNLDLISSPTRLNPILLRTPRTPFHSTTFSRPIPLDVKQRSIQCDIELCESMIEDEIKEFYFYFDNGRKNCLLDKDQLLKINELKKYRRKELTKEIVKIKRQNKFEIGKYFNEFGVSNAEDLAQKLLINNQLYELYINQIDDLANVINLKIALFHGENFKKFFEVNSSKFHSIKKLVLNLFEIGNMNTMNNSHTLIKQDSTKLDFHQDNIIQIDNNTDIKDLLYNDTTNDVPSRIQDTVKKVKSMDDVKIVSDKLERLKKFKLVQSSDKELVKISFIHRDEVKKIEDDYQAKIEELKSDLQKQAEDVEKLKKIISKQIDTLQKNTELARKWNGLDENYKKKLSNENRELREILAFKNSEIDSLKIINQDINEKLKIYEENNLNKITTDSYVELMNEQSEKKKKELIRMIETIKDNSKSTITALRKRVQELENELKQKELLQEYLLEQIAQLHI